VLVIIYVIWFGNIVGCLVGLLVRLLMLMVGEVLFLYCRFVSSIFGVRR